MGGISCLTKKAGLVFAKRFTKTKTQPHVKVAGGHVEFS